MPDGRGRAVDAVSAVIAFVMSNFTLLFIVVWLVVSAIVIAVRIRRGGPGAPRAQIVIDELLRWYLLFVIGVTYAYNWVFHLFFGELAASFIGWEDSPFQHELAWASLGLAIVALLAAPRHTSFRMKLAAVVGISAFLLGAAGEHVVSMVVAGNFEPGNAGVIFWTDILVPLAGFALLVAHRRVHRAGADEPSPVSPDPARGG